MSVFAHIPTADKFQVDLWFCYGSFCYGIESELSSCSNSEVALSVLHSSAEEEQGLAHFLDMILEKPKGLLRVELRVYLPDTFMKKLSLPSPIYLFTDIVPRTLDKVGASLALLFTSVQGISPTNSENWHKLVRQISQQESPNFFKKR